MALFRTLKQFVSSGVSIAEARAVVQQGLQDALSTMEDMCGNEGQISVFNSYVKPAFLANRSPIRSGWTDVDIGEYMDFMGEIVGEGNQIMTLAYEEAQDILSELEEIAEELAEEGF